MPLLSRPLWLRVVAGVLVAVLCVAGAIVFIGRGDSHNKEEAKETAENQLLQAAEEVKENLPQWTSVVQKNTELRGYDTRNPKQKRLLWSLGADELRAQNQGDENAATQEEAINASAVIYREGKPETSFRAARIILMRNAPGGPRMTLTGGVKAESRAAWTGQRGIIVLETPHVELDIDKRRLHAARGVVLRQGSGGGAVTVAARDMKADTALSAVNLSGKVKATTPDGAIEAAAADWNWKTGRAQARGGIKLTHDGTTLTGSSVQADTRAGRGVLQGDGRAVSGDGQARAALVHYDWKAGQIRASGGVTFSRDGAQMRAEHVIADDKLARAVADGGVTLQKGDLTLRAARIQGFDKMTRAIASGAVKFTRGDVTATAGRVQAFGIGNGGAARIVAEDGARFTHGGATVQANRIEAAGVSAAGNGPRAQRIVATGGARLTSADMNVTAGRVEATSVAGRRIAQVTASGDVKYSRAGTRVAAGSVRATNIADGQAEKVVADDGATYWSGNLTVAARRVEASGVRSANGAGGARTIVASGGASFRRADLTVSAARVEAINVSSSGAQRIVATGGARARNNQGMARGERVTWAGGEIVAEGGVRLDARGNTVTGSVLRTNERFNAATLSGDVRGQLAGGGTVRAPVVRVDKAANSVTATGGVSGRRDNLSLRADRFASTLDGRYAMLKGHVVVRSDDGAIMRAPVVRLDKKAGKVFASGGAYYQHTRQKQELRGQTVVYDIKTKVAVITRGSGSMEVNVLEDLKL